MVTLMPPNTWTSESRPARTQAITHVKLLVNSADGNYVCSGLILNCSERGIRIKTSFPFLTPGETVEIVLHDADPRRAKCRVVWVGSPGEENAGEVGLEFLTPIKLDCGSR